MKKCVILALKILLLLNTALSIYFMIFKSNPIMANLYYTTSMVVIILCFNRLDK